MPQLNNRDLLDEFLQQVAVRDWSLPLDALIRQSAKQFETEELSSVLTRYLDAVPEPNEYGRTMASGLPRRDAKWLLNVATLKSRAGFDVEQLHRFSQQMIRRIAKTIEELIEARYPRPQQVAETLPILMKAMVAADDDAGFAMCYELRKKAGELLAVREFDVVVCRELISWSDKNRNRRLNTLSMWLTKVHDFLNRATISTPKKPNDFTRPSEVSCGCPECQQLANFLAADQEHGTIKALKHKCEHLQQQIANDQLDAVAKIDRLTRPFTLRLTKTSGSFERATGQFREDLKLLKSLPE